MGLPLMSNFFEKSKDLYFNNKEEYKFFEEVINTFDDLHRIKGYYNSDLTNIEELLSILEMKEELFHDSPKKQFIKYIQAVITGYTPLLPPQNLLFERNKYFNKFKEWENILLFISSLLNLQVSFEDTHQILEVNQEKSTSYNIITLNYDLLIESSLKILTGIRNNFNQDLQPNINLLKLHGSVDRNEIIAPTWNKFLSKEIRDTWKQASTVLTEANHIRFIGYSLPVADSYIKYLIKSSLGKGIEQNLKHIDVICYDPTGDVKSRYDKFINSLNYKFINAKFEEYMSCVHVNMKKFVSSKTYSNGRETEINAYVFNKLETIHDNFMKDY
ncbi:MAG: SIR2 family protein [Ignavibacteriaceae bacterium]